MAARGGIGVIARLDACIDKCQQFRVPENRARELCNNAATPLTIDESMGIATEPEAVFLACIRNRMANFGLSVAWPEQLARELARTWKAFS